MKYFTRTLAAALLVLTCALAASAQVIQVSGKVTLKNADGTEVPVKDAFVDIYRTDISGKFQTKTDKAGRYIHAGIPYGGTYTITVSAPGATPTYLGGMRLNQQPENNFTLTPGDGHRLTLDEVKAASAAAPAAAGAGAPRQPSAEDKAKAAEFAKKIAEVEEKNKNIEQSNAIVSRTFNAGNEALKAKRYDEAITLFDEGLAARADEPGLLINRAIALTGRGVTRFNSSIQNKSDADRDAAFKDWRTAAESSNKAVELLKTAPAGDASAQANREANKLAALTARAEAMRFVGSKVDKSQAEAAFAAYQEYIAAETDPAKKSKAQFEAANVLFEANAYDRAITEFQKLLAADPENAPAYLKLGFALFNTGEKAKFQEAANYLAKFVEKAPDTDPFKADARSILDFLKANENIKPMKVDTPRPARRRG